MEKNDLTQYSYEEAMERLDQALHALDSGEVTLEESLQLFQDGLAMVQICQNKLAQAEGKIKLLQGDQFVEMGE